jgi:hypothetical protein
VLLRGETFHPIAKFFRPVSATRRCLSKNVLIRAFLSPSIQLIYGRVSVNQVVIFCMSKLWGCPPCPHPYGLVSPTPNRGSGGIHGRGRGASDIY